MSCANVPRVEQIQIRSTILTFEGAMTMTTQTIFTRENLPPMIVPTAMLLAYPKPGPTVAMCVAPAGTTISRPASWGEGQDLDIAEGVNHIAQDGVGDSYPNQEFDTFYQVINNLDEGDERAKFLIDFWKQRGHNVQCFLAEKVRPAVVVGRVTNDANGHVFQNHEGNTELSGGGYILQSPDDENVLWFVTAKVFDKKYQPVDF